MGLEVDEDDVAELVENHRQEFSAEDLVELQQEQVKVMQEEHSGEEEEEREDVSSVQIKDICSKWSEVQAFVERPHPNKTVTNRAVNILNDNVVSHFRKILQQRKKQVSLDRFLVASSTSKRQKREKTPEISKQVTGILLEGESPSKKQSSSSSPPPPPVPSTNNHKGKVQHNYQFYFSDRVSFYN
ncbi:hypothetical protein chiPu_0010234 [Chiloscyllium punctatum]|uniref:Uncharacterized protein n=1 Tax=Chiloscyllium punctatum TaxID=137246 RepID=A0A401SN11_CHIPU|nr:hypothetical protein [Chiloscyllium punctatum]